MSIKQAIIYVVSAGLIVEPSFALEAEESTGITDKDQVGQIQRATEHLQAKEKSLIEPPSDRDNPFVYKLKKDPSLQEPTVFYPKLLSDMSLNTLIEDVKDLDLEPLELGFRSVDLSASDDDKWSNWLSRLICELQTQISKIDKRSNVNDKLLVIETYFDVDKSGRMINLHVSPLCPADFHSMIFSTLQLLDGKFVLPDEKVPFMRVYGKFFQNFGPSLYKKKKVD